MRFEQPVIAVSVGVAMSYWKVARIRQHILRNGRAAYGETIVSTLSRQLGWKRFKEIMDLPPRKMLEKKLHTAIAHARHRLNHHLPERSERQDS